MARIRTIKPECFQHRKIGKLSHAAFRLWCCLLTQADDEGRLILDAEQLRVLVFGYFPKVKTADVIGWISEIQALGCVRLYQNGFTSYLDFPSWKDHQVVNRPTPSFLPRYDDSEPINVSFTDYSLNDHGVFTGEGKGREGKEGNGKEGREALAVPGLDAAPRYHPDFLRFWDAYPNKAAKGYAYGCWLKAIRKVTITTMLDAIAQQLEWPAWTRDGGAYIPHPSTWLNQERWADEPPKVRAPRVVPKMESTLAALEDFAHGDHGSDPVRGDAGRPSVGVSTGTGSAHD